VSEVFWFKHPVYTMYEGSSEGQIRSLYSGKILKPCKDSDGYLKVALFKDKKQKCWRVHRFIFECFFCPIPWDMDIDHLDNNRENNCPDNLEAVTHCENKERQQIRNRKRAEKAAS